MPTIFGSGIAGGLTGLDGGASLADTGGVGLGAGLLGQHQVSSFVNPRNGQRPIDANQVRANDTALQLAFNAHDANSTIHLQSSSTASRPAPSVFGRKWVTLDDTLALAWVDSGTQWVPVTVGWENLLNRPSSFVPSAHTHVTGEVVGLDAALSLRAILNAAATFSTLTLTGALTLANRQLIAGSRTYTWPAADGTAAQVLATDGSGALSWTTQAGAGGGGTPDWSNIINKPATFAPSAHTHTAADVVSGTFPAGVLIPGSQVTTGLLSPGVSMPYSQLTSVPATFAPAAHTQAWSTITATPPTFPSDWGTTINRPSTFAPSAHRHGWSELDNIPLTFAPSAHTHPWGEVTGKPTTFTPTAHTHTTGEIAGLNTFIDAANAALATRTIRNTAESFSALTVAGAITTGGVTVPGVILSASAPSGTVQEGTLWVQIP